MARDRKVDVVIGAKDKASSVFKTVGASIVVLNQGIELATKLARGMAEAYDFAKMGAEVEKTEFAFNRMSESVGANADQTLSEIRRLTGGTISDFDLMRKAAKATTLGIPIDKVAEFAQIARVAAAAMGESTDFMFDSIVTGTARQSRLILDNLGIIVSEAKVYKAETLRLGHALSDVEKKQAFMNAVIESGQNIVRDIGDVSGLTSEKFGRFEASVSNLRDTIAAILAGPIGSMLISLANMADRLRWVLEGTNALAVAIQNGDIQLETWNETFEESVQLMDEYLALMAPAEDKVNEVTEALMSEAEILVLVNEGLNQFRESLGQVPADASAAVDGINDIRTAQEGLTEATEATIEAQAKWVEDGMKGMEIIRKRALGLMKFQRDQLKKEVADREKAEKNKARAVQQATDTMMGYINKYQDMLIDGMLQGQIDLKNIFRNMAGDFLKLFIDQILRDVKLALVAKLIKMLALFDKRANDLMVIQMGRDYARYFQQGVFEGMDFGGLAGGMARGMLPPGGGAVQIGAAVPASSVTVIIQGNLIGEDESIDNLILAIEGKIATGETSILGTDKWLT